MVRSGAPEPAGGDQSLGELVSLAARDISQLVRYEINLAKTELRGDVRRAAVGGVLFAVAAFFGCLILFCLCFAWAYALHTMGAYGGMYGAFLWAALTIFILAVIAVGVAILILRHMSKMKKTRESVTEGLGMLRRDKDGDDGNGARKGRKGRKANEDKDLAGAPNGQSRLGSRSGESGERGGEQSALPDSQLPEIADSSPR
jgi:hypothetical protein